MQILGTKFWGNLKFSGNPWHGTRAALSSPFAGIEKAAKSVES
jgi:hypothetical protein